MQLTVEQAIEARKLAYEDLQNRKRDALQLNAEYGKWLVTSLFVVHGAVIAFLAQSDRLSKDVLPSLFPWHAVGLLLAFACGFIAWMNFGYVAQLYDSAVNPGMVYDLDHWPGYSAETQCRIRWTYRAAIAVGLASVLCIVGSAMRASCLLSATVMP